MGTFHLFGSLGLLSFSLIGGVLIQSEKYNKVIYLVGAIFTLIIGALSFTMFHCN